MSHSLTMLSTRGTGVVSSALKLSERFTAPELYESYAQKYGVILTPGMTASIRNQVQRLSSDSADFYRPGGGAIDLFAMYGRGEYSIREIVRPKLLNAANERAEIFQFENSLVIPTEQTNGKTGQWNYNNIIAQYAQHKIMQTMRNRGYEITDTSMVNAYDFLFKKPERTAVPHIMEVKGTQNTEATVQLTPNELTVFWQNPNLYWLGIVSSIHMADGQASGGVERITPPPVLDHYQFVQVVRLRLIPDNPQMALI